METVGGHLRLVGSEPDLGETCALMRQTCWNLEALVATTPDDECVTRMAGLLAGLLALRLGEILPVLAQAVQ